MWLGRVLSLSSKDALIWAWWRHRPNSIRRARECRSLVALFDAVRGGQSRVLVVRGDADIGTSALLLHLVKSPSDFRVVHTAGVESEMELPR